ncbi:hypothetical protein D3C73_1543560 [compost metagenome]
MAILRDHAPITPTRDDVLDGGDELFFVTTIAAEDGLRALLSPAAEDGQEPREGSSEAADQSAEDDGFDG